MPGDDTRWRCGACGNLTRFDVTRSRRTVEYWHADLAGVVAVEETEVVSEVVERVRCRWCGREDAIALVPRIDEGHHDPQAREGRASRGPEAARGRSAGVDQPG